MAQVNDHVIRVEEFERSYVQVLLQTGQNDSQTSRYAHLNFLIDEQLWYEEALQRNLFSDSLLFEFTELTRKHAIGGRYYEIELVEQLPELTDLEIRQAFARYKQPVMARHLFFRNEQAAHAAYERLRAGHSFLDEAQRTYQTEIFDSTAGWLGEIRYFQVDDAFAEAAFALSIDSFSRPVRTRQGWHIIKVEDQSRAPILTESEFQSRKKGLTDLLHLRKRRLEGDHFVRSFMQTRKVQVNPEAIRSLGAALGRIMPSSMDLDPAFDTAALMLTPETPLATFLMDGKLQTFTAGDYFFWLPKLPLSEATSNPAASVGRAIRNEAFALAGSELGLDDDAMVHREVDRSIRAYLANSMRQTNPDTTLIEALRAVASIRVDTMLFHQIMID